MLHDITHSDKKQGLEQVVFAFKKTFPPIKYDPITPEHQIPHKTNLNGRCHPYIHTETEPNGIMNSSIQYVPMLQVVYWYLDQTIVFKTTKQNLI